MLGMEREFGVQGEQRDGEAHLESNLCRTGLLAQRVQRGCKQVMQHRGALGNCVPSASICKCFAFLYSI